MGKSNIFYFVADVANCFILPDKSLNIKGRHPESQLWFSDGFIRLSKIILRKGLKPSWLRICLYSNCTSTNLSIEIPKSKTHVSTLESIHHYSSKLTHRQNRALVMLLSEITTEMWEKRGVVYFAFWNRLKLHKYYQLP